MTLVIQPMETNDIPAALALWGDCEGVGLSEGDSQAELEGFLQRNPGLSVVALENGSLAGAILTGHDGRRGFFYHLAVAPPARRQGLGSRLVEEAVAGLARIGVRKSHAMVYETNVSAQAFWAALGAGRRSDIAVHSLTISL